MKLLLNYDDGTKELLPISSAKTQTSGVATFNLPKWYERYTKDEQVKVLDYIGSIAGDTVNVMVLPLENYKYKFCKLFYKTEFTCDDKLFELIETDFIDSDDAIMWLLVDTLGNDDKLYFNKGNL